METKSTRERYREKGKGLWESTRYASVGIELCLSIVICYHLGRWAEARWDFAPYGGLGGVILGFASGMRSLIKIAIRESQRPSQAVASIKRTESSRDKTDHSDSHDFSDGSLPPTSQEQEDHR
jgi:hypothetical protein